MLARFDGAGEGASRTGTCLATPGAPCGGNDAGALPRTANLTPDQRRALTTRADLLAAEAAIVRESRRTWAGRLAGLGDYGRFGGGSSLDRRLVVEAMAALEQEARS